MKQNNNLRLTLRCINKTLNDNTTHDGKLLNNNKMRENDKGNTFEYSFNAAADL